MLDLLVIDYLPRQTCPVVLFAGYIDRVAVIPVRDEQVKCTPTCS